jgi:hypothetical protein
MMTSRERLMATLRGEPVDRPAVNFYEIGGFQIDPSDPDEFNVYNDPSWQPLLQLAEEQTDLIRLRSSVRPRSHEVEMLLDKRRAANCRDEFFKTEKYVEDGRRFKRITLKIGDRTMTSLTRRSPEMDTVWTVEHLLKSIDDLKAYLELPDEVFAEQVNVANLVEEDKKLGDRGVVMVDTEDPICAAAYLFSMEDFTIAALTEQKLFHRLLEKLSRHIYTRTEETAKAFPGHLWRIYGPEYATEPYLPPHLFKEYVVRYTGPMVETIQKYGGFARIHCHGRIRAILDYIVEMGAAAVDPIEPPPHGDVELEYVRREYGRELVLFGNIEIADIENMEPTEFEKVVKKALIDGTSGVRNSRQHKNTRQKAKISNGASGEGRGFVLMPSSAPNGRKITPVMMANYQTMIRLTTGFNL